MRKSISSSSRRAIAMYFLCCRTKKPLSSKNSRTIISLTAAIDCLDHFFHGDFLAPHDFADAFRQDESHISTADFLVELHGLHQAVEGWRFQLHARRQSGAGKRVLNPRGFGVRKTGKRIREARRGNLTD